MPTQPAEVSLRLRDLTGGARAPFGQGSPHVPRLHAAHGRAPDPDGLARSGGRCQRHRLSRGVEHGVSAHRLERAVNPYRVRLRGGHRLRRGGAVTALRRRGRFDGKVNIVAFAGDGGTADIGLQSLSGAMELYHDFVYVCLDNEAYMNTGYQRSSATPMGAWTSTSPVGSERHGKRHRRKDLMEIAAAHGIPYAAQASPSHWKDLMTKARKAYAATGPAFLNVLVPCVTGWKAESQEAVDLGNLALETNFWPLYEIDDGVCRLTRRIREPKPIEDYFKRQGRFRHLLRPEGAAMLAAFKASLQQRYERLLMLEQATAALAVPAAGGNGTAETAG